MGRQKERKSRETRTRTSKPSPRLLEKQARDDEQEAEDELEDRQRLDEPPEIKDFEPLASGGERRGEPLRPLEEEDDFEDGRSSSGLYSRGNTDPAAHGDVSSRAISVRTGVLSVEGPASRETAATAEAPIEKKSPGHGPLIEPRLRRAKRGHARRARRLKTRKSAGR